MSKVTAALAIAAWADGLNSSQIIESATSIIDDPAVGSTRDGAEYGGLPFVRLSCGEELAEMSPFVKLQVHLCSKTDKLSKGPCSSKRCTLRVPNLAYLKSAAARCRTGESWRVAPRMGVEEADGGFGKGDSPLASETSHRRRRLSNASEGTRSLWESE